MEKINNREIAAKAKGFFTCICFLLLLGMIFVSTTFLFRNNRLNRAHIVGIKQEGPLDMVYVGGSATYGYWQPLKAWNDCGFTSYNYATDNIQAENLKYYINEVLKTHTPELFVVDVRPFQYWDGIIYENGIRNGVDSFDLSLDRLRFANFYLSNRTIDETTDVLSYYIGIIKYHSNYDALRTRKNWGYIWNTGYSNSKGYESLTGYQYLDTPTGSLIKAKEKLPVKCENILIDLLEFCKIRDIKVLFVVSPYKMTKEDCAKYNTVQNVIESYGFTYMNTNAYYEEMNIDFATDFSNEGHVNVFGAEKYTMFLEKYIEEKYCLPDHRKDVSYEQWNGKYIEFLESESEARKCVSDLITTVQEGVNIAEEMTKTLDVAKWWLLANDSRFTLLIAEQGEMSAPSSRIETKVLQQWGIDMDRQKEGIIRVINSETLIYSNAEYEMEISEPVDDSLKGEYTINTSENYVSIKFQDKEYCKHNRGLNIVVIDNNYRRVVDSITIYTDASNQLQLIR